MHPIGHSGYESSDSTFADLKARRGRRVGKTVADAVLQEEEGGGGEDFLASARDHLDQFKNTTAERHWICLKNTVRRAKNTTFFAAEVVTGNLSAMGLDRAENLSVRYGTMRFFGPSKVGGESDTGANDTANSPGDPISLGFD
uniref:Uncharacterized protein n=1 Tax=Ananas comosus var. bracteatus TaxID=296719 RepID=A0A6V7NIE6_ANACO|nr:unnamed protein product [Ananas comosus var. bracteatus]